MPDKASLFGVCKRRFLFKTVFFGFRAAAGVFACLKNFVDAGFHFFNSGI